MIKRYHLINTNACTMKHYCFASSEMAAKDLRLAISRISAKTLETLVNIPDTAEFTTLGRAARITFVLT